MSSSVQADRSSRKQSYVEVIEALLNGEATMRSVRGDYLIATALLQDNGFVVARLSVEG